MPSEEEVVARLRLICGEAYVLDAPAEVAAYAVSGQQPPTVVVVPGTVNEVAAVARACASAQMTVMPRGAGTSPTEHSDVVIALARLRRIVDINREAVTVDAGAPVDAVRRALPPGSALLPELCELGVGTVGGVLACGYGRRSLLAIELVTETGSLTRLDRCAPGYDLGGAFVGSAGGAGIAVRTRLRLSRSVHADSEPEGGGDG
jgi:glycolate oxidase